jgi:hypothetical protein
MSLIEKLCLWVAGECEARHIGKDGDLYLSRYYLFPRMDPRAEIEAEAEVAKGGWGIVLHQFHRSDADEELHNHPWGWGVSLILTGGYFEERRCDVKVNPFLRKLGYAFVEDGKEVESISLVGTLFHGPGTLNRLRANTFHRVLLQKDASGRPVPAWTLFVHGPRIQSWGFWHRTTQKFTPWQEFIQQKIRASFDPAAINARGKEVFDRIRAKANPDSALADQLLGRGAVQSEQEFVAQKVQTAIREAPESTRSCSCGDRGLTGRGLAANPELRTVPGEHHYMDCPMYAGRGAKEDTLKC